MTHKLYSLFAFLSSVRPRQRTKALSVTILRELQDNQEYEAQDQGRKEHLLHADPIGP